jgi:hypothetical protein
LVKNTFSQVETKAEITVFAVGAMTAKAFSEVYPALSGQRKRPDFQLGTNFSFSIQQTVFFNSLNDYRPTSALRENS